ESDVELRDLQRVQRAWDQYLAAALSAADRREEAGSADDMVPYFERVMQPARVELEHRLDDLVEDERHDWQVAFERSRSSALRAGAVIAFATVFGLVSSVVLALVLRRRLQEQFHRQQE